jgi:hypothetical protein
MMQAKSPNLKKMFQGETMGEKASKNPSLQLTATNLILYDSPRKPGFAQLALT